MLNRRIFLIISDETSLDFYTFEWDFSSIIRCSGVLQVSPAKSHNLTRAVPK